jgi:Na+/H+-translocating membrane pyrophosphatase
LQQQFGLPTAGFYGVALAASAMMATMQLAIDAFGPISDNANCRNE